MFHFYSQLFPSLTNGRSFMFSRSFSVDLKHFHEIYSTIPQLWHLAFLKWHWVWKWLPPHHHILALFIIFIIDLLPSTLQFIYQTLLLLLRNSVLYHSCYVVSDKKLRHSFNILCPVTIHWQKFIQFPKHWHVDFSSLPV